MSQVIEFQQYQRLAYRTTKQNKPNDVQICDYSMGLAGEVGELVNIIKKGLFHGHIISDQEIAEELGDCLWYIATLASCHGLSLEQIARDNIKKLQQRYPQGFTEQHSKVREG